jgi:hypothetical protein
MFMPRFSQPVRMAALALTAAAAATVAHRWLPQGIATAQGPTVSGTPSPAEQAHADLHARYAEARLRLAQANLAKAEHLADAAPHQVNDLELASLRRRVAVLERHSAATRARPHGNAFDLAKTAIEKAVLQAEKELTAARAANARRANTVSTHTLAQLEAAVEVARARLAIWEDPSFLDSPEERMQMQIDHLADEVFELVQKVDNRFSVDRR